MSLIKTELEIVQAEELQANVAEEVRDKEDPADAEERIKKAIEQGLVEEKK